MANSKITNEKKNSKPQLETRRLAQLHPHPDQEKFFKEEGEVQDANLRALADDIAKNGLDHPIEVLPKNKAGYPKNMTIRGHRRCLAMKLLNLKETRVLVRYDLANATRDEIDAEFLRDNLHRRQMDVLSKARAVKALLEKERGRKVSRTDWGGFTTARDYVGGLIGMSGRTLDRYIAILETPLEVQEAFRSKRLKLADAARVALLFDDVQASIAAEIRDGKDPRDVVRRHLDELPKNFRQPVPRFRSSLKKLLAALEGVMGVMPAITSFGEKTIETVRAALLKLNRVYREMDRKRAKGDAQASLKEAVEEIKSKMSKE